MVKSLWHGKMKRIHKLFKELDELVYRFNLIGGDRAVCNWGSGNTSMKTIEKKFRGCDVGKRKRIGSSYNEIAKLHRAKNG